MSIPPGPVSNQFSEMLSVHLQAFVGTMIAKVDGLSISI